MNTRWSRRIWGVCRALALLALGKGLLSLAMQLWPRITPPAFRFLLTGRWRRHYRDPAATLAPLDLRPGMRVVELGPGPGMFTAEAVRQVGCDGRLLCVDLQRGMLRPLQRLVRDAGLRNVALHCATAERLPFRDSSVDLVYAIAVLPMVVDKAAALRELRRVLRPGGVLAVSEDLIEPEYVPPLIMRRWCQRAGFMLARQIHRPLWYTLIFTSPERADDHPGFDLSDTRSD